MAAYRVPSSELTDKVRKLIDRIGVRQTARLLDQAEGTVARIAGGLKIAAGTELHAAARIEAIERDAA